MCSQFFFLLFKIFCDVDHFQSLYWFCYKIDSVFWLVCSFFFWLVACGILGPPPGIKPAPFALGGTVLTTSAREVPAVMVVMPVESLWALGEEYRTITHGGNTGWVLTRLWHISTPISYITLFYVCFYLNTHYLMCIVASQHWLHGQQPRGCTPARSLCNTHASPSVSAQPHTCRNPTQQSHIALHPKLRGPF